MNRFNIQKQPLDVMQETAEKVRVLRKSKKWSQEEFSQRSGVSLGSLKRFESTGQISFTSLLKLGHVLGRLSEFESLFMQKESRDLKQLFSDKS